MPIQRLNHAVFYIRDVATTQRFYTDVMGFDTVVVDPGGRFLFMRAPLSENHHDIAFFAVGSGAGPTTAGRSSVGLYHVAWEVGTIAELEEMRVKLSAAGALIGASDHGVSLSLYSRDPDGLEFEVMWAVPPEHWGDKAHETIIEPLDLAANQRHYAQFGLK